jgi:UDP-N-acetylglucosamine acyltransferase
VEIGPFSVVEAGAVIGQGCKLASRVTVKSETTIGRDTTICEGVVLGGMPQHISPPERPGRVIVGERCALRENVTVHRAMKTESETRIGNDCLLMVDSHVAHDCVVGNRVILTNSVLLGGHVQVGDRAVVGGGAAVHQYCRIGRLTMVGGCTKIVQDVPPFVLTDGTSAMIVGLNRIGLKRSGMSDGEIRQLKNAYRAIYRRGLPFAEMLAMLDSEFSAGPAAEFAEFFRGGKRGFVQERRSPPRTAIRLHPAVEAEEIGEDESEVLRRAG